MPEQEPLPTLAPTPKSDLELLKEHHLRLIKFKGSEFFKELMAILDNKYKDALSKLKAGEDAESRGILKMLDALKGEFDDAPNAIDNIEFYKKLAEEDY